MTLQATDTAEAYETEDPAGLTDSELWDKRSWALDSRRPSAVARIDDELSHRGLLVTIEVDTADMDGELIDWLVEQQSQRGLKARVTDVFGPGGGNPVVEWSGSRTALEGLLREAYDADDADVAMYLG